MKDLAKEVRQVLKREYPTFKFSVTSTYNSIRVSIMEGDLDFGSTYEQVNHFHIDSNYQGKPATMLQAIADLLKRDQRELVYDGDYGSVPTYYVNLEVGKWDKPYRLVSDIMSAEELEAEKRAFAEQDLALLKESGHLVIVNTRRGTLFIDIRNGLYCAGTSGRNSLFTGYCSDDERLLRWLMQQYTVELEAA